MVIRKEKVKANKQLGNDVKSMATFVPHSNPIILLSIPSSLLHKKSNKGTQSSMSGSPKSKITKF